jgi:hypothetical protein
MTERSGLNHITCQLYSGATPIAEFAAEMKHAQGVEFGTMYPGGLYEAAKLFIPRDPLAAFQPRMPHRLVIRNHQNVVFEGEIASVSAAIKQKDSGIELDATGYWGALLGMRHWAKRWTDNRISSDVWVYQVTSAHDNCTLNRDSGLRFLPLGNAWTNGDYAAARYTMPTGGLIKRITFDYDLDEGGQSWALELWDSVNSVKLLTVANTTSTGSVDHALATPVQHVELRFYAKANQTPSDARHGYFTNIVVYVRTGANTLSEFLTEIQTLLGSSISTTTSLISANNLDLKPYHPDKDTPYSELLLDAAKYGDASANNWAIGVKAGELVSDTVPVLFAEQYPALTDYDYAVRVDESNVAGDIRISRDYSEIHNWIILIYKDQEGNEHHVYPDDDSSLKDQTSIDTYGQKEHVLTLDFGSDQTIAISFGKRWLAQHKDPQWRLDDPIRVRGYIRGKAGNPVAASEIQSGKRVRIENFIPDLSGTGLTFIVTETQYNDDKEECEIRVGSPNRLLTLLAQQHLKIFRTR